MLRKDIVTTEQGAVVRVTFTLPSSLWADAVFLHSDFSGWDERSHPFRQDRAGVWTLTLDLEPARTYAFCYECAGQWMSEMRADGFLRDDRGRELFLVVTPALCDQSSRETPRGPSRVHRRRRQMSLAS